MLGPKPGFLRAILEPAPTAFGRAFHASPQPHLLYGAVWLGGRHKGDGAPRRTAPSRAEVPPEGTGGLECTIQDGNAVLRPPVPTLVMVEWVRQLGGRRGTSCFPPRVGGGGRGAPPGVTSQARGATSSSVGRPSFLRLLSYGVGRAARHAPPPRLRGWRSGHHLRCLSSFNFHQSHTDHFCASFWWGPYFPIQMHLCALSVTQIYSCLSAM